MWEGRHVSKACRAQRRQHGRSALRRSLAESEARHIDPSLLCELTWHFRFKRAAGEHWTGSDPYWQGARARTLRFEPASAKYFFSSGCRIWDASVALARQLQREGAAGGLANLAVVELGSGVGLPGLAAARFAARVLLTDAEDALLPNLRANAVAGALDGDAADGGPGSAGRAVAGRRGGAVKAVEGGERPPLTRRGEAPPRRAMVGSNSRSCRRR